MNRLHRPDERRQVGDKILRPWWHALSHRRAWTEPRPSQRLRACHPFAVHAELREHQQQAVVELDGPVDWLDEFMAPLHVFRSEPDPPLFATHLLVQPPSELLVLAAIADEARLVLNRLHRPAERRQIGDEILRPWWPGRVWLPQSLHSVGIEQCVGTDDRDVLDQALSD